MNTGYLLDVIDGSLEVFIMMLGFTYIYRERLSGKRYRIFLLAVIGIYTLINALVMHLHLNMGIQFYIYLLLMAAALFLYSSYIDRTDLRNVLALDLYLVNTVVLAKSIAVIFTTGWIALLLQYVILILVMLFYIHAYEEMEFDLSWIYWSCVMVTPVLITTLWQVWRDTAAGDNPVVLAIVIVLDAMVYFLFTRLIRDTKNQSELALSNDTLLFQIRQMDTIKEQFESVRSARHELKNNYFVIETMAEQKDYEGLKEFIHREILPSLENREYVSTGNCFVDMILSQKVTVAKEKNIPIEMDIAIPEQIRIKQQYLASLLFNLLDNAIEASEKLSDPDIHFYLHQDKGYLNIRVKNRIQKSVLSNNPDFLTTKKDKKNHGIGTRIIRRIVNYCDGNIQYQEINSYFIVNIMLPLEND